jgi:hypothetical protein
MSWWDFIISDRRDLFPMDSKPGFGSNEVIIIWFIGMLTSKDFLCRKCDHSFNDIVEYAAQIFGFNVESLSIVNPFGK